MLTLVVAIVGMAASLPLGVVLALGRRSELPVIRILSTVFIEIVRGVPLITVLYMASLMLPLFLPPGVDVDKLLRLLNVQLHEVDQRGSAGDEAHIGRLLRGLRSAAGLDGLIEGGRPAVLKCLHG